MTLRAVIFDLGDTLSGIVHDGQIRTLDELPAQLDRIFPGWRDQR